VIIQNKVIDKVVRIIPIEAYPYLRKGLVAPG
jgi:hypothetical protein